MRGLPCLTPGCKGHEAFRGVSVLSDGSPHLLGRAPVHFPYRSHCSACGRKTTLTLLDWNKLPRLSNQAVIEAVEQIKDASQPDLTALASGLVQALSR